MHGKRFIKCLRALISDNTLHLDSSQLMLLSPILTMGAGLAIAVGVALQSKEVGQFIIVPSPMAVRTMVAGAASTLGLFVSSLYTTQVDIQWNPSNQDTSPTMF